MPEVADLYVILRAETAPFAAGMRTASAEGESFTAKMGGIGGAMTKLGAATTAVGVGVAVVSVKMAGDFQASMQKLVTTAGESQANLGKVSQGVKDIAIQTGTSTKSLSDGMYMVESAGFHGADGLKVLSAAAQGARAEQAPLAEVSNAVTSALKSYHLPASDAVTITNQMVAAVGHGKMTFSEFSSSLSTVLPIAASAHLGFDQVGGAIATLTNHGTSAREATQELAFSIRSLQAPNNVAVQEMQKLGLSSVDVSTHLGQRGLTGTIGMLQQAVMQHMGPAGTVMLKTFNDSKQASADLSKMLGSMTGPVQGLAQQLSSGTISLGGYNKAIKALPADQYTLGAGFRDLYDKTHGFNSLLKSGGPDVQTYNDAMKKMMGGATGLNTALMLGGENMGDFQKNVAAVGKAGQGAGKNIEGWDKTQKTFNVQMGQLKERVEVAAITIGTKLIPIVSSVIKFFTEHKAVTEALGVAIGVVLTGAVLKFATGAVVGAVKGIGDIGKGVAAAGKAVKAFAESEKIAAAASKIWAAAEAALNVVMDANPIVLIVLAVIALIAVIVLIATKTTWFQTAWKAAWAGIKIAAAAVWGFLKTCFDGIMTAVGAVVNFVKSHWPLLLAILTGPIGIAVLLIVKYWDKISSAFSTAYHAVIDTALALVAWVVGLPGRILAALVSLGKSLWHWATDAFTQAKDAATTVGGGLITWVTGIPGRVLAALSSLGSSLWTWATNAFNRAKDAAVSVGGNLISWVVGLPGQILSALGDLGGLLYRAGKNLIQGLINGVKDMIGSVGDAIGSVASTVRSYWPFSPAKRGPLSGRGSLDIAGANMGQMLADGITGSTDKVARASSRLAGAVSGNVNGISPSLALAGVTGSGAGALALANGGGGTVINHYTVNISPQGSILAERDLRDTVQQQMLQLGARNSQTWQPYHR